VPLSQARPSCCRTFVPCAPYTHHVWCIHTHTHTQACVRTFWTQASRPDGRPWSRVRATTVVPGILQKTTAGSALARLGATHVVAGVTLQIGQTTQPNVPTTAAAADQGDLLVHLTSTATVGHASASYTALTAYVQRLLLESLDARQLVIQPGCAWRLVLTIQILQEDGNLTDACLLAAVAALAQTQLPIHTVEKVVGEKAEGQGSVLGYRPQPTKALLMPVRPVSLTVGSWYDTEAHVLRWVVDPTAAEEAALEGSLTLVVAADGAGELLGVELRGACPDFLRHLTWLEGLARQRAAEVRPLLWVDA
jgi:exosome complex RNA-binding protein Rrp42 (RNase PH superfamily)